MKKVMAWLAALCLLALSVAGALTTAAAGNTAGTAVSGLVHDADGRIRYYENGVPVAKGLVRDDEGNVYYIWNAVNGAARGMFSIPEDKLNGIMPQGFYEFGADYRMIVKNGIYTHDWCDHTYYFVNSVPEAVGLAKNEDGDIYYFTTIYGVKRAATDGDWYIPEEKTNGLMPEGTYHFNQYGLLTGKSDVDLKPVEPKREEIGENLFRDLDGVIRYYENGQRVAKGLVRDYAGDVYYIWSAENGAARGIFSIPEDKLNGIMPQGFYEFGADNRMIIKNGIYTHDWCDYTYYFVNSVPQAIGIATDGEGHYYFFTNIYGVKRAATDQFFGGVYYVSEAETNGLIEKGFYRFNSDGIMVGRVDGTDTEEPTTKPTEPTEEPTTKPTEPTEEPTTKPAEPTEEPTTKPAEPTEEPTTKPAEPTEEPTTKPAEPTEEPTTKPAEPTEEPTTKPAESAEEPTTKPAESAEEPTTKPAEQTGATTSAPASGTQTDGSVGSVTGTGAVATTTAAGKSGGCASAVGVGGGVVLLVTAAAACLSRKRRH